jgi:hypothetical protein
MNQSLIVPGFRIGYLECVDLVEYGRRAKGLFKCTCGTLKVIRLDSITSGKTRSCGCMQTAAMCEPDISFDSAVELLRCYRDRYATANIPRCDPHEPYLSRWVIYQRKKFRDGSLSDQEILDLRSVGLSLDPRADLWRDIAIELLLWIKTNNKHPSRKSKDKNEAKLGRFIHRHAPRNLYLIINQPVVEDPNLNPDEISLLSNKEGCFTGIGEREKHLAKLGLIFIAEKPGQALKYWVSSKFGDEQVGICLSVL